MKSFDAIYIFAGSIVKDDNGSWHTTKYDEGDTVGALGDYVRVIAGSYLAQDFPDATIVASGGKGYLVIEENAPLMADVISDELVELGIDSGRIKKEIKSGSTFEQLKELVNFAKEYNFKNIAVISNRYHIPRIKLMVEKFDELSEVHNLNIQFVSAEDVLIDHDAQKWEQEINQAYQSEGMKERIVLEQKGIEDIKAGKYVIKK